MDEITIIELFSCVYTEDVVVLWIVGVKLVGIVGMKRLEERCTVYSSKVTL